MSEIRQDIITGEWVFFAAERKNRPHDFMKKVNEIKNDVHCPFCRGNEGDTPKSTYELCNNDGNWVIRTFSNMYPAVSSNNENVKKHEFYKNADGKGFHEVVVDTPEHIMEIEDFSLEHMFNVLKVLKNRFEFIKSQNDMEYIQIFKNKGPEAGASLQHSHWQIVGIPVISLKQKIACERFKDYYSKNKSCLLCDVVKNEIHDKVRIIDENELFISFAPYASKITYEMYIVPKNHVYSYEQFLDDDLKFLSDILKKSLLRIRGFNKEMCYNICFQDKPLKDNNFNSFHWYLKIIPRTGNFAGFEFATGSFINHILPEEAAKTYRNIKI